MIRPFLHAAIAAAFLAASPVFAADNKVNPMISVSGEGVVQLVPDTAILSLAVMKEGETARAALDENNADMAAIIAALKEEGIEARDLQTSGLSIQPQYVYPNEKNGEEKPRITGYQVSNSLTVRVRNLEKLGTVMDRTVSLGVNQGGNITFTNNDTSEALKDARKKAVADAMEKARTLAEAAGGSLGKIIGIAENNSGAMPMPVRPMMRMAMSAAADAVPVEAGENTYTVNVNMTLELVQD